MPRKSKSSSQSQEPLYNKDGTPTVAKAMADFERAFTYKHKFLEQADEDFRLFLGQQWEPEDARAMEEIGVKPLVLNKISPVIRLLRGIESQNRSDPKAFPEGKEDSVEASISTGLLKNVHKNSEIGFEMSEIFEDGTVCGECYIEPYLDFTDNFITGKLATKKIDYWNAFPDPEAKKYDHSDGQYFCKVTYDITKDQLLMLFPDQSEEVERLENGKINFTGGVLGSIDSLGATRQRTGYNADDDLFQNMPRAENLFDLLEYYYKHYVKKYYVGDLKLGGIKEAASEEEAKAYVAAANDQEKNSAKIIVKTVPEIWYMAIIGGLEKPLVNERAWFYPRWKNWPFVPFFCYRSTGRINSEFRHLKVQGIVRQMKDAQWEHNKRRIQELRHLGQSANSGWLTEEGAWTDKKLVEKFGSTPGVNLEYKRGSQKPERINPAPLSQAHAQLAKEFSMDMKESSGINTDLLAMQEGGTDSGRAIALRQKQGLTMVQGLFDNFARTKKILNKFILSQLSDIYTIETAQRVLGEAFLTENFSIQMVDPMSGMVQLVPDKQRADQLFDKVLRDSEAGNYDVSIGDIVSSESMQFAVFSSLMELVGSGVPIPPDVLIEESMIPEASKKKIVAAIQQQMAASGQKGEQNAKR